MGRGFIEDGARRAGRAPLWAALVAAVLVAPAARAQKAPERVATAQGLYDEAAALIRAGQWAEACPKLEESQRLDPAMGTQFFLASCYENVGRPTSAWSLFLEVAAAAKAAGNHVREGTARARAAALEPKLPRLAIVVPEAVARTPGIEVRRDGVPLKAVVWGTPVPVDLGVYVVRVTAPDRAPWEASARVETLGERVVITVPPLANAGTERPAAAGAAAPPRTTPEKPPRMSAQRIAALPLGATGLAAVAAGGALGLLARSSWRDAEAACPDHVACSPQAHDGSRRAISFATGSTAAFALGGAAAGGAILLWLTAPSPGAPAAIRPAPLVGAGVAGAVVEGRF